MRFRKARPAGRGATLVELVIVILITGIVAAAVAVFIRRPVEGYVDVIAMVTAGFPATVAPLGTALTEDQLSLMWKMAYAVWPSWRP